MHTIEWTRDPKFPEIQFKSNQMSLYFYSLVLFADNLATHKKCQKKLVCSFWDRLLTPFPCDWTGCYVHVMRGRT